MHSDSTLLPMVGVGVFNVMFWIGFIVGYDIGLTCNAMLINGLLFGGLGSYSVVKLVGSDRRASRPAETKEQSDAKPEHSSKPVFES